MREIHIGTQGWNYNDWVGAFYPCGSRATEFLDLYVRAFDTVEIDSSFYAIPSEASIKSWNNRAPNGFTYSLKLPRQITHEQRLHNSEEILVQFCERIRPLGEKLAMVLIQLPPDLSARSWLAFEKFVGILPADIRFAVEFRDSSWVIEPTIDRVLDLLSKHEVAIALVEGQWVQRGLWFQLLDRPTSPLAYVRWMGPRTLTEFSHVQIDRNRELQEWTEGFKFLYQRVKTMYGYFSNYFQGHSPASANQFKRMIGQAVVEPESLIRQPSLF
ncbi:MAG: DUF72 domain-containing protein [Acidobacteria bacterium]|nr:DUF72 domain-containing protein [Acidobacteriota bacterium]